MFAVQYSPVQKHLANWLDHQKLYARLLLLIVDEVNSPMPRFFLQVAPHLEYEELAQRVQQCQDPIEKKRWLAIQLMSQPDRPMTAQQAATVLGYSSDWVRKQVQRYNRLGARGLVNGRQQQQLRKSRRRIERDCLSVSLHRS